MVYYTGYESLYVVFQAYFIRIVENEMGFMGRLSIVMTIEQTVAQAGRTQ